MISIFDFYASPDKREELKQLLTLAGQKHPDNLGPNFLEKDIWVTEILRLLYDEKVLRKIIKMPLMVECFSMYLIDLMLLLSGYAKLKMRLMHPDSVIRGRLFY